MLRCRSGRSWSVTVSRSRPDANSLSRATQLWERDHCAAAIRALGKPSRIRQSCTIAGKSPSVIWLLMRRACCKKSWLAGACGTSPGYVGTELYRDLARPDRFVTLDRWQDEAAFRDFSRRFASDYEALDQQCAGLTRHERPLGEFQPAPDGGAEVPLTR